MKKWFCVYNVFLGILSNFWKNCFKEVGNWVEWRWPPSLPVWTFSQVWPDFFCEGFPKCHLKLLCMIKFILQPPLSTKFFFIIINYRTDKFVRKAVHFFYRQTLDYSLSVYTMTFQKFNQTPLLAKSISILTLILIVERSLLESTIVLKFCVTNI